MGLNMTDNRIQYFVPGLDDSFEKGWHQTNDNGVQLSDTAADADVFELGNLIVINAHTPAKVISAGAEQILLYHQSGIPR